MKRPVRLIDRRFRGFRVVEVACLGVLAAMVFAVYLTKAAANEERAAIAKADREIAKEQRSLRLLRAEAAHLERPDRIERLSEAYLGLAPVAARKEAQAESLPEIAIGGEQP
jgi:cell division protein FtsL